ncbi:hypothetical protein E2C01_082799 [Portunus trituberculatus]|uniref:Uncharacterized protein n=1 Tax=Portunus trituberculatus TaxID=210409 RepID=A0A5B7J2V0_PORTR|nr:hypothetical protein [Portunus trituberculatus]
MVDLSASHQENLLTTNALPRKSKSDGVKQLVKEVPNGMLALDPFPAFPSPRHSSTRLTIVAMLEGAREDLAQQFSLPALTRTHESDPRFALALGLIL